MRQERQESERHPPLRTRLVVASAAAALVAALLLHFAATVLYVTPFNPIRLAAGQALSDYMLPLFEQNWGLFAPDPINEDRGLLVRARVRGADGSTRVTEFLDVTTPAVEAIHDRRLLPPRRSRLTTNAIQLITWQDPVATKLRERSEPEEQPEDAGEDSAEPSALLPDESDVQERGRRLVAALASAAAVAEWGEEVEAVQVRVVFHRFPRFSERHALGQVGEVTYSDLEWMPRREVTR